MKAARYDKDKMSSYGPDVALDVMGPNVIMSVVTAIPGFFGGDYVIAKLLPKPDDQQNDFAPITYLEPKVLESTHPGYPIGTVLDSSKGILGLIREGINVAISPTNIRSCGVGREILEEGPYDSFVLAEISPDSAEGFGHPNVFCSYGPTLLSGRNVGFRKYPEKELTEALCQCNTHFAFVPAGEERRTMIGLDKGWRVIR